MEYRRFGQTDMELSTVGLGGLLARYEGINGHPPPEEKRRIYLRAAELGVNLFDMGYGDEVHIPDELKGPRDDRFFSLKVGAPAAAEVEGTIDKHLANVRREAIDILRVHHYAYLQNEGLAERIAECKAKGKVRALCLDPPHAGRSTSLRCARSRTRRGCRFGHLQLRLPLAGPGHCGVGAGWEGRADYEGVGRPVA